MSGFQGRAHRGTGIPSERNVNLKYSKIKILKGRKSHFYGQGKILEYYKMIF